VRALLALLLTATVAHAQPAAPSPLSADNVLAKVEAVYRGAPGLSAKFTQTTTNAGSNKQMMYDGKDFYSIDPDGLVIWHAKTTGANAAPAAVTFMTGAGSLAKDFTVAFGPAAQLTTKQTLLELTPKQPNAAYAKLVLVVDPATWRVTRTQVIDSSGNTNTFDLAATNLKAAPKDSQFTFDRSKYPATYKLEELK
jgi:outer membrane lipoprotein-sorting protein